MSWKDILKGEFEQWRGAQNQPPADIDNVHAPYNKQLRVRQWRKLKKAKENLENQLQQNPNDVQLQQQLAEATKANNDLTTKLGEVEKEVGDHKTLLSKVKESAPESVTKLSSDSTPSKVDSYLSTRKTF